MHHVWFYWDNIFIHFFNQLLFRFIVIIILISFNDFRFFLQRRLNFCFLSFFDCNISKEFPKVNSIFTSNWNALLIVIWIKNHFSNWISMSNKGLKVKRTCLSTCWVQIDISIPKLHHVVLASSDHKFSIIWIRKCGDSSSMCLGDISKKISTFDWCIVKSKTAISCYCNQLVQFCKYQFSNDESFCSNLIAKSEGRWIPDIDCTSIASNARKSTIVFVENYWHMIWREINIKHFNWLMLILGIVNAYESIFCWS